MPRLGELLVAAGLLTVEQVTQALRTQVLWGGRLGTNLIELHHLELDLLSKVLGQQHRLPAALARHFEKADPDLQRRLPPELAEELSCVPLLRMGPEQHVVIASLAPLPPRQLAIIADELAVDVKQLVPAIAAELRIRYQLERVYRIRRAARFLRTRGKTIPPLPDFQVLPVPSESELERPSPSLPITTQEMAVFRPPGSASVLPGAGSAAEASAAPARETSEGSEDTYDDLIPITVEAPATAEELDDLARHDTLDDDLAIPTESIEDEVTARQRRKYVRTIADEPSSDSERPARVGKIELRKIAISAAPRIMAGATLGEATRAIRHSTDRDRVAELVIDALDRFAPACDAAILLVLRGATAIGWKGFQRGGNLLGEIAVPIEDGGLVPRTIAANVTSRKPCGELAPIDRLLLASLGRRTGDLAIVPIAIGNTVVSVIAIAAAEGAALVSAETIAEAAGAVFARLMRNASR
jgi:hypothetical protein